ncbi:MAG: glutathione peroxidase [Chitinophagales bacterium]|nr:glutathione peroxidase [Bacteroidota bacterium]
MKRFHQRIGLSLLLLILTISCNTNTNAKASSSIINAIPKASIYDFTMKDIDGNVVPLSTYKGKILVIVNTASQCGLVDQLGEIESFYKKYKDKNVVVLGFPSNDFLGQEPLSNADIKKFCSKNYGVTFPMFSKISVKGNSIDPLYRFLTSKDENGVIDAPVKWNYQKFIIDKNGKVVTSISPRTTVNDEEFLQYINDLVK